MRKNVKKRIIRFLCVLSVLAVALLAALGIYMKTTMSYDEVREYAAEHSCRGADEFFDIWPSGSSGYVFLIAQNGDSGKPQEMYVFESYDFFHRYRFVDQIRSASDVGVYSYRSPQGEKYRMVLENYVYFSDNSKNIGKCKYVISTNGIEKTYEERMRMGALYFELQNIGQAFNVKTKIISVEFYDRDGNLVEDFRYPNDVVTY